MARLRKRNTYLNLKNTKVYKVDSGNEVFKITNIPSVFPRGKSYFLALGSDLLEQGTDLLIEIIDSEGNVVYNEIPYYLENSGRAISVWVYNDNSVGFATLTILGVLKNVPSNWKNKYNVKYQTQILIDPNQENNSSIKFVQSPEVTVKEKVKKYVSFTQQKTQLLNFNSGSIYGVIPGVSLTTSKETITSKNYISSSKYEIQLSGSGFEFTKEMIGAKVLVANPIAYTASNDYVFQPYTASITGIKNSYTAYVDKPYKLLNRTIDSFEPIQFTTADTDYSIQYTSAETGSSTVFTSSYAKFDFSNLQTFSGRINNVRIYKKDLSTDTSYLHVGDFLIEPRDFLLYETDFNPIEIGIFDSSSKLSYWVTTPIDDTLIATTNTNTVTQSIDKLYLFNSVNISRPNGRFKFYPNQKFLFRKDHEYTLKAKFATKVYVGGAKNISSSIDIYASGSSFSHDFAGDLLGKKIGTLSSTIDKNFGEQQFNFICDNTASGSISFQINSGKWYLSDISLKPAYDYGFGPDESTIFVPLNSVKRNEVLVFKIEYLSSNNNIASEKTEIEIPTKFVGNPLYIELTDNLLTGSLSIGNVTGSGIEISGLNSAYIRSVGYKGFISASQYSIPGFIIYSGSVLSGSGDEYRGLGIEIHAGGNSGSLRYRVDNSGSFLEISGSIYAQNGYFSGFISASSGFIGGWVIGDDSIYKIRDSGSVYIYSQKTVEPGPNQYDYSGIVIKDNLNLLTGVVSTTGSTNPNPSIFAGGLNVYGIDDKPFYVLSDGYLKTSYGTISNWFFSQSVLTSSEITDAISQGKVQLLSDYSGYISRSAGLIVSVYGGRYAGITIRENHDADTPVLFAGSTTDPYNTDTRWWVDITGLNVFNTIKARTTPGVTIEKIYSDAAFSGSANDALVTQDAIKAFVENSIAAISGSSGSSGNSYWTGSADGSISRNSNVRITGSLDVSGSLNVSGSGGTSTIRDSLIISGSSYVSGNQTIVGTLTAVGYSSFENGAVIGETAGHNEKLYIRGDLNVNGTITSSNIALLTSSWALNSLTASHLAGGFSANSYWTGSSNGSISRNSNVIITGSLINRYGIDTYDITSSYLKNNYDASFGRDETSITEITGSLKVTSGITGSLLGTSSYAITASYALTASLLLGTITSASYAVTASYALNGGGVSTGSSGVGDKIFLWQNFK